MNAAQKMITVIGVITFVWLWHAFAPTDGESPMNAITVLCVLATWLGLIVLYAALMFVLKSPPQTVRPTERSD